MFILTLLFFCSKNVKGRGKSTLTRAIKERVLGHRTLVGAPLHHSHVGVCICLCFNEHSGNIMRWDWRIACSLATAVLLKSWKQLTIGPCRDLTCIWNSGRWNIVKRHELGLLHLPVLVQVCFYFCSCFCSFISSLNLSKWHCFFVM